MSEVDAARGALLAAALPLAATRGWTDAVVAEAVAAAGIDRPLAARALPQGAIDLVIEFHAEADRRMVAALAARDLSPLRFRERVALAVRLRLEALAPHRDAARRALALQALPANAARAAASVVATADSIWRALGDRAADFSFYTKRASLAAVCAATFVAWLGDDGEDHAATWAFLDRRIGEVMAFGALRTRAGEAVGVAATTVRRAVSRILPPAWRGRPSGAG